MTAEHFVVERYNDLPLRFEGEKIVDLSSRGDDEGTSRWQEIRIYFTTKGNFVTEVIGKSTREGEHDIIHVRFCRRPEDVRKGLIRKAKNREFYTDLALEALEIANRRFPGIDDDSLSEIV